LLALNYIVPGCRTGLEKFASGCMCGTTRFSWQAAIQQVAFYTCLLDSQGLRQGVCLYLNKKQTKLKLLQGKQNLRAACLKGKPEFYFFQTRGGALQGLSVFL